jgi:hypothetical protein
LLSTLLRHRAHSWSNIKYFLSHPTLAAFASPPRPIRIPHGPQLHENAYQADRSKLAQERAALSAELAAARQSLAAVETEHRALHSSASSSVAGAARANAFERLRVQESALVRSRGLMCRFCNFACSQ